MPITTTWSIIQSERRHVVADEPLRIGLLGAANITPVAVVEPAKETGHRLVAVAARDRARAARFAAAHGVERVADSYAALIADPGIDVVYNALPNGLHAPWNLAALAAGKHVLTEKPSASNAEEAAEVRDAAEASERVFMEGFHYVVHPVMLRLLALLASGRSGELQHAEAHVAIPAPADHDPRWSLALAGGAVMDIGCYALHALRSVAPWAGGEPAVVSARAGLRAGLADVDEWLDADIAFPGGATGSAVCSMAADPMILTFRVLGSRGEVRAENFVLPRLDDRLTIRAPDGERVEYQCLGRQGSPWRAMSGGVHGKAGNAGDAQHRQATRTPPGARQAARSGRTLFRGTRSPLLLHLPAGGVRGRCPRGSPGRRRCRGRTEDDETHRLLLPGGRPAGASAHPADAEGRAPDGSLSTRTDLEPQGVAGAPSWCIYLPECHPARKTGTWPCVASRHQLATVDPTWSAGIVLVSTTVMAHSGPRVVRSSGPTTSVPRSRW